MIRTDTDCDKCEHKKVCKMVDRPKEVVEHLNTGTLEWRVDDHELDIVVSCINEEQNMTLVLIVNKLERRQRYD